MRHFMLSLVALLALGLLLIAPTRAQPRPAAESQLYLPMLLSAPRLALPPGDSGPAGTGALFPTRAFRSNSAAIAIDQAGALHLAYAEYLDSNQDGQTPAFYATCATNCADAASWHGVQLGDDLQEVQLALAPEGRPRLLLRSEHDLYGSLFQYAACDAGCANAANWRLLALTDNRLPGEATGLYDRPQHYFALDAQGRPRFIYSDERAGLGHYGTFYAYCDADCTAIANWYEIQLDEHAWSDVSLAFTRAGEPRIAYSRFANLAIQPSLYYVECADTCAVTELGKLGLNADVGFVLKLDTNDRPRIALRHSRLEDGTPAGLLYLACEAACLQAQSWQAAPLGLAQGDGLDPDLAFDVQGRAHIAFRQDSVSGLGYAWCDANCAAASSAWHIQTVETGRQLDGEWSLTPPAGCDTAWVAGFRPAVMVDSVGRARIAYDAENITVGCTAQDWFRAVRVVLMGKQ